MPRVCWGPAILLISFLFLYFNLFFANRGPGLIQIGIPTPTGQITAYTVEPEKVRRVSGVLAAFVGLILGVGSANSWELVWRWLHRVDFNVKDPIFFKDVSFYFFSMPLMRSALRLGLTLSFLALIAVVVLYYFKGSLTLAQSAQWRRQEPQQHPHFAAGRPGFYSACGQRVPGSLRTAFWRS